MRALVIEDDAEIAHLNSRLLEREGFAVDIVSTVHDGKECVRAHDFDLIMLDMGLPDGHGIEVLHTIREKSRTTPVLIVSGANDIDTTVQALDAGADDYLHKPYKISELGARVRALLRRSRAAEPPIVQCGNVTIDRMVREAMVDGNKLDLTPKEFTLLEYFVKNRGRSLTRTELLDKVWRFDFDPGTNMVDVNVSRLRGKLKALGSTCRVESERGVGYVFAE